MSAESAETSKPPADAAGAHPAPAAPHGPAAHDVAPAPAAVAPALVTAPPLAEKDVPYRPKFTPRWLVALTLAAMVGLPGALILGMLALLPLLRPATIDAMLLEAFGVEAIPGWPWPYALGLVVIAVLVVSFGAIFAGILSWYERRVAGRIQSRIGPNRAGFAGFFVWMADAFKLLLKEDLVPAEADAILFRAAPYFVMAGFALPFVVLPFGHSIVATNLDVGVFYVSAVTALSVVGFLLAGWASNSKWSLFGGMRSAAQVVSYEIPSGLSVFIPVAMAGTLSLQGIIRAQGGLPWEWFVFRNPAAFIAFFILFTSGLAEANRTPFDLPEAESELVAGHLSEYSGFRFALFFLAEWGNIWVISAMGATLFLGGWQIPGVSAAHIDAMRGDGIIPSLAWYGWNAVSMAVFFAKTLFLANVVVWLRWTLPRIRVDQAMGLCWKYLVPAAFTCFLFTLGWMLLAHAAPVVERVSGFALTAFALVVVVLFALRVRDNIRAVKGDRVDLSNW